MKQRRNRPLGQLVKLAGQALALDTVPAALSTDPGKMTVTGVITAETRDRENDIVLTAGIDLADHTRNPVVLLDHGLTGYTLAVAKAEDTAGLYTVRPAEGFLEAITHFTDKVQVSEQLFALYDAKIMRAFSIGFIPKSLKRLPANPDNPLARPGYLVESCLLTEYSCCAVGCNGDALTVAYEKNLLAGRQLHPLIRKSLTPFVLPRKRSVNGAALNPGTKAMADELTTDTPASGEPIQDITADDAASDDRPAGVRYLSSLFDQLAAALAFAREEFEKQEKEQVLDAMPGWIEQLADVTADLAELHNSTFPDEPKLTPPERKTDDADDSDEGAEDEPPTDKRLQSPNTKALTKAAANCIKGAVETFTDVKDNVPMSRVYKNAMEREIDSLGGLVKDGMPDDASEDVIPKAEYEKLLKNFQTLETNHKNLTARVQRAATR